MDQFEDGLVQTSQPASVTDRYYTKYYSLDVKGRTNEDQCVLQHSNRVCIVCVAPSHKLLHSSKSEIEKIEFQIGKLDRTSNTVSGKFKNKGDRNSPILRHYVLYTPKMEASMFCTGTLLEVNQSLLLSPELLIHKPLSSGFIAIILPKLSEADIVCQGLITEEEYKIKRTIS